jgi:CheY-like chemotaxis protein
MIVDDDDETLALLREIVAKEGYEVETAADAETALRRIGNSPNCHHGHSYARNGWAGLAGRCA